MCFWMVVLVIIIFFRGRYAIYGIIAVDSIKWSTDEEVRPFGVLGRGPFNDHLLLDGVDNVKELVFTIIQQLQ